MNTRSKGTRSIRCNASRPLPGDLTASNTRPDFSPSQVNDGKRATFWATAEGVHAADLTFTFHRPTALQVIRLREHLPLGQRVERFVVEVQQQDNNGAWQKIAEASSIGACRLLRLDASVTARRVRVRFLESPAPLAIAEVGLFPSEA